MLRAPKRRLIVGAPLFLYIIALFVWSGLGRTHDPAVLWAATVVVGCAMYALHRMLRDKRE